MGKKFNRYVTIAAVAFIAIVVMEVLGYGPARVAAQLRGA